MSKPTSATLLVRSPSAEDVPLHDVPLTWTVGDLKARLQSLHDLRPLPESQKLVYFGRLLGNAEVLGDCLRDLDAGVPHTIHLIISGSSQAPTPAQSPAPTPVPRSYSAPTEGLRHRHPAATATTSTVVAATAAAATTTAATSSSALQREPSAASPASLPGGMPMSPAEYAQAAQAYAQYYASYMNYYYAMAGAQSPLTPITVGAYAHAHAPAPQAPFGPAPTPAQTPTPAHTPAHPDGAPAAAPAQMPPHVEQANANPDNANADNANINAANNANARPRGAFAGGLVAPDDAANNDLGAGEGVAPGGMMTIPQMVVLIMKLGFFIFMFGQHATVTRFRILIAIAVLIFLFSSGIVNKVVGMIRPPAAPAPAPAPAPRGVDGANAAGQGPQAAAADPDAEPEDEDEETSLWKEVKTIVVAFFGSLIPGRLQVPVH